MSQDKFPYVDVIICSKNNEAIIGRCLDSIKNQSYKKINCFVVDDNSTDSTRSIIKKYSFAKCIHLTAQLGPAYNRNIAIQRGDGKYIVTMDSDAVLKRDWIEKLVKFMEKNPDVGISSGKILYENDRTKINMVGGGMNQIGIVTHWGVGEKDDKNKNSTVKRVFYLCSAAMIIRRSILDKIGLFDEIYYYGYEDLDLSWRANLAGFKVVYVPTSEAYHEENTTINKIPSAKITFLGNRNRMFTLLKNYELKTILLNLPFLVAHFCYLLLFRKNKKSIIAAYFWILQNRRMIYERRKKIKTVRLIKDKELAELT